jgi:hypothetical protein
MRIYELPIASNVLDLMNPNDDITMLRVQLQMAF